MSRSHPPTAASRRALQAGFVLAKARKVARQRQAKRHRDEMRADYPELVREQERRRKRGEGS